MSPPARSSASARRTRSRYAPTSSCWDDAKLNLYREPGAWLPLDRLDARRRLEIRLDRVEMGEPLSSVRDDGANDRHLERLLRLGSAPADLTEHFARVRPFLPVVVADPAHQRTQFALGWPCGAVDGPLLPPRPHLLRRKWKIRREQPQINGERCDERAVRRTGGLRSLLAVTPALYEIEVIVVEAPGLALGAIDCAAELVFV